MPINSPYAFEIICLITLLTLAYFYLKRTWLGRLDLPIGKKNIPVIPGGLPIVGHALPLTFNGLGFIKKCFETHGSIFQIRLFMTNIVVICDHGLAKLYMNSKEENLSFKVASISVDWTAAEGRLLTEDTNASITLKHGNYRKDYTSSNVANEGYKIIEEMNSKIGNGTLTYDLNAEVKTFITRNVLAGFIPMETTEQLFNDLRAIFEVLQNVNLMGLIFPIWFLKLSFQWRLSRLRRRLLPHFAPEIRKYREDQQKCDSIFMRRAVDFGKDKRVPSDEEIVELIVSFLFGASVNTPEAITNAILLLSLPENRAILDELREECTENSGDVEKILAAPFLHACVMETSRLTTQLFLVPKAPVSETSFVGDYHIGNQVHYTFLSPQMLQVYGDSSKIFHEPTKFKPRRFLGIDPEPQSPPAIITWGGGLHLCPGKPIAINIIKITVAQLLLHFDFKVKNDCLDFDYNCFSAFGRGKNSTYITRQKLDLIRN